MISRDADRQDVLRKLKVNPVVAILGARQVGKTTLARQVARAWRGPTTHFDMEDEGQASLLADPMMALARHRGLIVIDEVQLAPQVFASLRVLADRRPTRARFLLLGSVSPTLIRGTSESLAGRIAFHDLGGFALDEVGIKHLSRLWIRGGFPRSFLARSAAESYEWCRDFVRTFLERDLPRLGIGVATPTMRRFWTMLAHYHGQVWNSSEIARSLGVSDVTVRGYLDLLTGALVMRQLLPWHENIGKRQVKAPKIFVRDSGLLHALLGIPTRDALESHPKLGASWEGFMLEQVIRATRARPEECYFWATHSGAELDLLLVAGNKRIGFEIKRTSTPRITPSITNAINDLRLDRVFLIHGGNQSGDFAKHVRAVAAGAILEEIGPLR